MNGERARFVARLIAVAETHGYPTHGRQSQIAQRYQLTQPSVRKWFTGETMPSYEITVDLCKRAQVHFEWLMTGRGPKFIGMPDFSDPSAIKAAELVMAMEPDQRPLALRLLDSIVEPPAKKGNGAEE